MKEDIAALVKQYQAGEDREEAFRQLFQWCYPRLSRFFDRRGFSAEESNDLAQEVLLRVANSLEAYRGESSFESWLFGVAANVYRNELRRRRVEKWQSSPDDVFDLKGNPPPLPSISTEPSPLEEMLSSERSARLREAVENMPSQMRQCFQLRYASGLKYQEIAVVMKISLGSVKAHLFQSKKVLREKLGFSWDER